MPAIGLNHYNLRAPHDLMLILRDFYCNVVGLEEGERPAFNSVGFWLYAGGRPILHLSQAMNEIASEAVQEVASDALLDNAKNKRATTFDHVAFTCIDQAEMRERLALHHIAFKVAFVPITQQTQLFFKDPAGNGIELNFEEEIS